MTIEKMVTLATCVSIALGLIALLEILNLTSELRSLMFQVDKVSDKLRSIDNNSKVENDNRTTTGGDSET